MNHDSNFVIIDTALVRDACTLDLIQGITNNAALRYGGSFNERFPDDAVFHMSAAYPHDMLLADNLNNLDGLIVASLELKRALEAHEVAHVEYLPVGVIDHKGKRRDEPYWIIHPTDPVDAFVAEQSGVTWSSVNKSEALFIERLIIDERRIAEDRALFKLAHFPDITLVRRDLAAAITSREFTGLRWIELANYPED
jgi:hypothetical protein